MTYPKLGLYSIVPAADLTNKDSAVNTLSNARVGADGVGKQAGMLVLRDSGTPGASQYQLVFARGAAPTDLWSVVDGSASYTPA